MKASLQIILLFSYVLFIPVLANADIVGGHDRQRLSLQFQNLLQLHFRAFPVQVDRSIFPLTLAVVDANPLFDVLVEEGGLTRHYRVGNVNAQRLQLTRVADYKINPLGDHSVFLLGQVQPIRIVSMDLLSSEDGQETYQLTFLWRLQEAAPWIWAPALNRNQSIQQLREAVQLEQTAQAIIGWQTNGWQLESVDVLKLL